MPKNVSQLRALGRPCGWCNLVGRGKKVQTSLGLIHEAVCLPALLRGEAPPRLPKKETPNA